MAASPPDSRPRSMWGLLLVTVVLAAIAAVVWLVKSRPETPSSDPVAAAHANARGVGHMEQFTDGYPKAVAAFEEAGKLAPDWTPAKINLGIALYNSSQEPATLDRAAGLFRQVLAGEPDNPYAHHNLGVIAKYRGDPQAAAPHFEAVTRIDPNDPHAWLLLAQCDANPQESPHARECFAKALALNPYLNAARYGLISHTATGPDERTRLLAEFNALTNHPWQEQSRDLYTEFGKYAAVIDRPPGDPPALGPLPLFEKDASFKVALAAGTRWAGEPGDEPYRTVRDRFGGTLVQLDFDRDGKPDLLLLLAVQRNGKPSDLLLHNDGNGTFTDVTEAAGLGQAASLGCSVGDFDNDGRPDLLLTGPAGVRLLRNEDGKRFVDKSAEAGFDKLTGMFLGSAWVDLDQDGDLDAVLARSGGGVAVQINVGEAPPVRPGEAPKPLTCKFRPAEGLTALPSGPVTSFVAADLDADRDVDLLVLTDNGPPTAVLNDRLMRFHRGAPVTAESANWNGGLVLDANGDDQSDLFLLPSGKPPVLLMSSTDAVSTDTAGRFASGATDSPPLKQAQAIDLDLDGRTDIVGLSADRKPVLLHGDGRGRLANRPGAFGPNAERLTDLLAAAACDLTGDGYPDLLAWTADAGLTLLRSTGNGNRGLRVELTGQRERASPPVVRTNADAVGATVSVLAGPTRTRIENTTLFAGLGQSRLPLVFGLRRSATADALRIRWPDGVPQAESNLAADKLARIPETDRRGGSCPILLTWDGDRFRYVTDFLGAGSVGEVGPDGGTRPPRPEESVKIESGQLVPRDGRFVIKIAEPMDEVTYLDHLRLDVIDHPVGVEVHPDERFAADGPPTQQLLAFRDRFGPMKATDHRGRDVTAAVRARDGKAVDGFAHRSWIGFAEDHAAEFDFGDQLAGVAAGRRVFLVLAGWTDYPYPEAIYAAAQARVPMAAPQLERQTADGRWESLGELGFPAGLPKVMTREVPGLAGAKGLKLRVRTNLQIYWDQVYLAPLSETPGTVAVPVSRATLAHRGFLQEVTPDGKRTPVGYTDDRTEPVSVTRWRGNLTRTGDVTPLLTAADDRFVLCGPGDEVTVEFDASRLPPVRPGHARSFVLRTHGYCKDAAPFTKTGGDVGPLPCRGMSNYPGGAVDRSKAPPGQADYDREWNTRPVGGR